MSEFKRAYDLLRGYIGREWERIQSLERLRAEEELGPRRARMEGGEGTDPVAPPGLRPDAEPTPGATDAARKILGVAPDAKFDEIRRAFEKLNRRCDPANFPEGSAEAAQALTIRRRIHTAYRLLTRDVPDSEKRFRSLEVEETPAQEPGKRD